MIVISLTPEELSQEEMSKANLDRATEAIRSDGFVVLDNIVSLDHLDCLREKMEADSQVLIASAQWGGAGRVEGHLQQDPPPFAPYVFRDIVANPFVIQVTRQLLGDQMYCSFYSGNVNCPGSGMQPLHRDMPPLWPNLPAPHPTSSLIVNVALVDVTEENGSIELWPGSHLETEVVTWVDEEKMEARRKISPPVRGNSKKGSMLIRDARLWHRGMPNRSDNIRHMIAMIHHIRWFQRNAPLKFNKGCEDVFESSKLDWNIEFTDEPVDYLLRSRR